MTHYERPDAFLAKREMEESTGSELFDRRVVTQWESLRPRIDEFSDVHSGDERERDRELVRVRESEYRARPGSSMRLEYMMLDGFESRNWLGETTEVMPASRYDDLINGVDMVIRFDRGDEGSLFLGVDVTTSPDAGVLREKIERTARWLEQGKTATVKYYRSGDGTIRGRLHLPRVVLGTDRENTQRLYDDFVRGLSEREAMRVVDLHPLQIELLRQIQHQLAFYAERALEVLLERRRGALTEKSEKAYRSLSRLLERVKPMELAEEIGSDEWGELLSLLNEERDLLDPDHDPLARSVFLHLDLFDELERIAQEKDSQGIRAEGAHAGTEETLELPEKSLFVRSAA